MDFETIVRRAGGFDGTQPDEAPDAMIDMDDEIAGRQTRHLGDEILGTFRRPPRPHQAVAENVLLADHDGLGGLEPAFEPEHGQRDLRLRQRQRILPRPDGREIGEPVVGEHMAHALAGAFAPERDDDALAVRLQRRDVRRHRLEHVAAGLGPLGGEVVPLLGADVDRLPLPFRHGERREPRQRGGFEPFAPLGFAEIEPIGRQGLIGRTGVALAQSLLPRVVIILDLGEALVRGILRQGLQHHR